MSGVVCIVQARMGSSRLPGKVMLPLAGGTVLSTVVDRVHAAKRVDRIIVATSMSAADAVIANHCVDIDVECYRGSEADVLDRVYQAAVSRQAEYVVDITADCPLVDPRHVDRIVAELVGENKSYASRFRGSENFDYVSNCIERDWPDGLDIQAYTVDALKLVHGSADSVRAHVGWNIVQQADAFECRLRQTMAPRKYRHPDWGLTLDELPDYALLKRLFNEAVLVHGNNLFPVEWVLDHLIANPDLLAINASVRRKEPGVTA